MKKGKGNMSVTYIPDSVKFRLWGKAAGQCQYDGCPQRLWLDELTKAEFNTAYIAHIVSDKPDGPRGHATLSALLASDISNLMLLCKLCRARHNEHYADYRIMPRGGGPLDEDAVSLRGIIRARSRRREGCRRGDSDQGWRGAARCVRVPAPSSRGLRRDTSAWFRSTRDQARAQ